MPLEQQYPYYEKTLEQSNKKPLVNLSTANNKLSFTKVSSNVFYIHGSLLSMDFLNISRQMLKRKKQFFLQSCQPERGLPHYPLDL